MTNEEMDEAIARYRLMTPEQFREAITTSPEFRFAIQAAYKRSDFTSLDRDGWNPMQFNVHVDPARPSEKDRWGPGAPDKEESLKPLPGAMLF